MKQDTLLKIENSNRGWHSKSRTSAVKLTRKENNW